MQVMQAGDDVRAACRQAGFDVVERHQVDNARSFDWNALLMASNSMSLFGDRKIVDLHIPNCKPGNEGSAALKKWCDRPPEDTVLLITAGKPEGRINTTAWYKALDAAGVVIQARLLDLRQTRGWIQHKLQTAGLQPDGEALDLLVERVEGNLLAANQEVQKLAILYPDAKIGAREVLASVTNSSRYTVLDLIDSIYQRDPARALKVLDGLRLADDPTVLICWHLSSEVRKICTVLAKMAAGESSGKAMYQAGVWKNRQPQVSAAIRATDRGFWLQAQSDCSYLDRLSKGMAAGDIWTEIAALTVRLAGRDWPLSRAAAMQ